MNNIELSVLKNSIQLTLHKIKEEKNSTEIDFDKFNTLVLRVIDKLDGNVEGALKLIEFALKEMTANEMGEFDYMLHEINSRSNNAC
jgi:hypothetical protein